MSLQSARSAARDFVALLNAQFVLLFSAVTGIFSAPQKRMCYCMKTLELLVPDQSFTLNGS